MKFQWRRYDFGFFYGRTSRPAGWSSWMEDNTDDPSFLWSSQGFKLQSELAVVVDDLAPGTHSFTSKYSFEIGTNCGDPHWKIEVKIPEKEQS